jgi:hypothetical protein
MNLEVWGTRGWKSEISFRKYHDTKREKKLNPHANTPAVVKMNEINPKYENARKILQLLTNRNPGFLYKV